MANLIEIIEKFIGKAEALAKEFSIKNGCECD